MDLSFAGAALLCLASFAVLFWLFGPRFTKRREIAARGQDRKSASSDDTLFERALRRRIPAEDGRVLAYLIREYGGKSNKKIAGLNFYLGLGEGGTVLCAPPVWSLYLLVDDLLVLRGDEYAYRILEPDLWPTLRAVVLKDMGTRIAEKSAQASKARLGIQAKLTAVPSLQKGYSP